MSAPSVNKIPLSDMRQNMSLSATGKKGFRKGTNKRILQVDHPMLIHPSIPSMKVNPSASPWNERSLGKSRTARQTCSPRNSFFNFIITKTKTLSVEDCSLESFSFNHEALTLCLKVPFFNFAPLTLYLKVSFQPYNIGFMTQSYFRINLIV